MLVCAVLKKLLSFKHCMVLAVLSHPLQEARSHTFGLSLINVEEDVLPLVHGMLLSGHTTNYSNSLG